MKPKTFGIILVVIAGMLAEWAITTRSMRGHEGEPFSFTNDTKTTVYVRIEPTYPVSVFDSKTNIAVSPANQSIGFLLRPGYSITTRKPVTMIILEE
jgi:hypothetical protein